jgi:two-component system, LytTR family, response regulator
MNITSTTPHAFALLTSKGLERILVQDVVHIEAISNYSKLHFANGRTLVVAKVLRWFEERLPAHFIRTHRTHLVNGLFVVACSTRKPYCMRLHNNGQVAIAGSKRRSVVRQWEQALNEPASTLAPSTGNHSFKPHSVL